MVSYRVGEQIIELPRNVGLLDTNVLVAFIDDRDGNHEQALLVIDEYSDYEWAVSLPVIIEACGLLGSRRDQKYVQKLLRWLVTPGTVRLLPGSHPVLKPDQLILTHVDWMAKFLVDYVDAHLMDLADSMTVQFDLRPHMPIFTFDTRDFLRCAGKGRMYSLFDMRELQLVDFSFS